jgi:DNA-binding CsgD family transcriptional regulator
VAGGRYLAEKIRGARFVEIPGRDHPIWTGDVDRVADEIGEFLTGARPAAEVDRVLATLLIGRWVPAGSVSTRYEDAKRHGQFDSVRDKAVNVIESHGGRPFAAGVREIAARFDGPARAVRCALAVQDAAQELGLGFAASVHVGEVEIDEDTVAGRARDFATQIAERAEAGEILVSGVVTDLAAGSGLHFADHGSYQFEGLDDPIRLLTVVRERHLEPSALRQKSTKAQTLEPLSAREREVLELVADGLSNAAIAKRLRLSDHTVKRHVANILLKLDLPTRAAAAAFLARQRSL